MISRRIVTNLVMSLALGCGLLLLIPVSARSQLWPITSPANLLAQDSLASTATITLTRGVTAVAAGGNFTCALTAAGGVKCWGDNGDGELGNGTTDDALTPMPVSGLESGVVAIRSGAYHTCALTAGGGVLCWGDNRDGQIGDDTISNALTPMAVSGLSSGVTALAAGEYHTCALTTSDRVFCWGRNTEGQLGDGTTNNARTPVAVHGLGSNSVSAMDGGGYHTCAATAAGLVLCWGRNDEGQLGDGTTIRASIPVTVNGLSSGLAAVAAGYMHTCGMTPAGAVVCWGNNVHGQLGDGTTVRTSTPVTVSGLSSLAVALAAGGDHNCAATATDGLFCWGWNWLGQLGDDTTNTALTPVAVKGLNGGVSVIAGGIHHTCAVGEGLHCWGNNALGPLGDGTTTDRHTPTLVVGLEAGGYGAIYDATQVVSWRTLTWTNPLPASTVITLTMRAGDVTPPDVTWSQWVTATVSPAALSALPASRYIQMRAVPGGSSMGLFPGSIAIGTLDWMPMTSFTDDFSAYTVGSLGEPNWGNYSTNGSRPGQSAGVAVNPISANNGFKFHENCSTPTYCFQYVDFLRYRNLNDFSVAVKVMKTLDTRDFVCGTPEIRVGLAGGTDFYTIGMSWGYYAESILYCTVLDSCTVIASGNVPAKSLNTWYMVEAAFDGQALTVIYDKGTANEHQYSVNHAAASRVKSGITLVNGACGYKEQDIYFDDFQIVGALATITPTVTPIPTVTITPTVIITPTVTPIPTVTITPTVIITPTVTPIPTVTSMPTPPGDGYEPDDTCGVANAIDANGVAQRHNFHQAGDADWVRFNAFAGTQYVIQTKEVEAQAFTQLGLFNTCAEATPGAEDDDALGQGAIMIWVAPATAAYYVRIANRDPGVYGDETGYSVSVRAQPRVAPAAIIVGGHDDRRRLQANINHATDQAYHAFLAGGLPPDRIYYLSPDEVEGRDAATTSANLQHAIVNWAAGKVGAGATLYLYLVDHGGYDVFITNGSTDRTTVAQLNEWLSALEAAAGLHRIVIMLDACQSGSFIDPAATLSDPNRVVMTSTGPHQNAYPSLHGAYFSDALLTALGESHDLCTSFEQARAAVLATSLDQTPWLDADGDKLPNEAADCEQVRSVGLASSFAEQPPIIDQVRAPTELTPETPVEVRIRVRDDVGIGDVWVVIYPPSFVEPEVDGTTPEIDLPRVNLVATGAADEYAATLTGLSEPGSYRLVFYATDNSGGQAQPRAALTISQGYRNYLPLIRQ
jgi:alpha-tubulin suppressor-like RCC1 family protein